MVFYFFCISDIFASPMWAELNVVRAPSLRCLAQKLPEIVLGSRADSTTLTYLNGFKRWCAWANRFPEVAVLPATPAYVSYICSVFSRLLVLLRRSRTPSIASAGLMILLVSTLLEITHFPRRSWSPLRGGYYTLLPKSSHYT